MPSKTANLRQLNRNLKAELEVLKAKLVQVENDLSNVHKLRPKIDTMSSEVVDSNPYSRLMALQRMGVVENYSLIREKTVVIVGVGGVGSVTAEMIVRCGIGRLILFDYDKVEMANMNRLFFQPHQSGLSKVAAAAATLGFINPDVHIEAHNYNITLVDNFEHFLSRLSHGGQNDQSVDVVLSCVDNFEARMTINKACNQLNQVWFESGVSEDAVSCHIQLMYPGRTPCFECLPPLIMASGIDEKTLKREGVCAASLPTTMALVSALLVQNTLKYLLNFGEVSSCLGYGAAKDSFYRVDMKCNPDCADEWCKRRRHDRQTQLESLGLDANSAWNVERLLELEAKEREQNAADESKHEDNPFGIELEPSDGDAVQCVQEETYLAAGIKTLLPTQTDGNGTDDECTVQTTDESLEALMAKLTKM